MARLSTVVAGAGDRASRWLPVSVRRRWAYRGVHHRWPHLRKPVLFSEKVNWRIAYDRRPVLLGTCDKLEMKAMAADLRGDVPLRIPRTLWSGTQVGDLAQVDLPEVWVLKPNHRSGLFIIGDEAPEIATLEDKTRGWLDEYNWSRLGEWAYSTARRTMLAEEWIGTAGVTPADYKVFVFHGQPLIVQVDENRHTDLKRRFYTAEWEPLPTISGGPMAPAREAPLELGVLLEAASRLGQPFDYMRVDLYVADGEVWFGEFTPYPGGGLVPFHPLAIDIRMGTYWQLPELGRGRP